MIKKSNVFFSLINLLLFLLTLNASGKDLVRENRITYSLNSSDSKKVRVRLYDNDEVEVEVNSVWVEKKDSVFKFKINEEKDFFGIRVTFALGADEKSLIIRVMGLDFALLEDNINASVGFSGNEKLTIKINDEETKSLFVYSYISGDKTYREISAVKRKKEFFQLREEEIDLSSEEMESDIKYFFLDQGRIYRTDKENDFSKLPKLTNLQKAATCDEITTVKEKTWNMRIEYFDFLLKCQKGEKVTKKKTFSFFGLF